MHDIVIRNATIIDGTGEKPFIGDIAIQASRISAVGQISGSGIKEIDAQDKIVTPGFVDIHTHYDGQATWDTQLTPSIYHGVTTVVMGNCGVGFAPVKAEQRDWLIRLMEGVEDIPGTALAEGIDWQWETFPEFLDTLDQKSHMIDIVAQIPHGALRTYVMGERGGKHDERPTADEILLMAELTEQAIVAGAVGFSTSRTVNHKTADGEPTPSLTASADELNGIAQGLKRANQGVIQLVCDFDDHDAEFELLRSMAKISGRPLSVSLNQDPTKPDEWRQTLDAITQANIEGLTMTAQVAPRPVGVMLSLQSTYHPFILCPTFQSISQLPLTKQVAQLEQVAFQQTILKEYLQTPLFDLNQTWIMTEKPDYEPTPEDSIAAIALQQNTRPEAVALNAMLANNGTGLLYFPALNYAEGNSDISEEMLNHPYTVPGLGDGGAHVSFISDASFCTYLLTHWARDRKRGNLIPLPQLIKNQTHDTAKVVGLQDRGLLKVGYKADLNIIDFEQLELLRPEMVSDLPAGGNRLMQRSKGYEAMIVSGEIVMEKNQATGALPGKLVRGAQKIID